MPANTLFAAGVLTINFSAASESVTVANAVGGVSLSGATFTGAGGGAFAGVNRIVVADSGSHQGQSLSFGGENGFTLPNGLDITGVENVTFDRLIDSSGGTGAIAVNAPQRIVVGYGATLISGTAGVSIVAQGNSPSFDGGIFVAGQVTAVANASIVLDGTAAAGDGIAVFGGDHRIRSLGSGSITLHGVGASHAGVQGYGVYLNGGSIDSEAGPIQIHGTATIASGNSAARGFYVQYGSVVAGGDLTIVGNGADQGIYVGTNGLASSLTGNVALETTGGEVVVASGGVSAHGIGDLSIASTSGISLVNGTATTHDGDISIQSSSGINVRLSGVVSTTGAGAVTLHCGGQIQFDDAGTEIRSAGGPIRVSSDGTTPWDIEVRFGARIVSTGGDVEITTDSINLGDVDVGNGTVTIQPKTAGTRIRLGGNDDANSIPRVLGLWADELARITAGTLHIGNGDTGAISLEPGFSLPGGSGSGRSVVIESGEPVVLTSAFSVDIDGSAASGNYTQVDVAGSIDLNGVALVLNGQYVPAPGEAFAIVNNTGSSPIIHTFANLPEGAIVTRNGQPLRVSYVGGSGNDVVLTHPTPHVSSLLPAYGPNGGVPILVIGTGFTGTSSVTVDGQSVAFTVLSDTSISLTVPAHAAGVAEIVVAHPTYGSSSTAGSGNDFTYLANSTALLDASGNLVVSDASSNNPNAYSIVRNGANVVITDVFAHALTASIPGTILSNGGLTLTIPLTSIPGSKIVFNGEAGNDALTVDWAGGGFGKVVEWHGGTGVDSLDIAGDDQGIVTYAYQNTHDGSIQSSEFGVIVYTGLEPISNTGTSSMAIFNLPSGGSSAILDDDVAGDGMTRLRGATFETTSFLSPADLVLIFPGSASDRIEVADAIDLTAGVQVGSLSSRFDVIEFRQSAGAGGLLQDDGSPGNSRSSFRSGASPNVRFYNPLSSLIVSGDASNVLIVESLPDVASNVQLGSMISPLARMSTTGVGGIHLAAGKSLSAFAGSIDINAPIATSGGPISLTSGGAVWVGATIQSGGGDVTASAASGVTIDDAITTAGGMLRVDADNDSDGIGTFSIMGIAGTLDESLNGVGSNLTAVGAGAIGEAGVKIDSQGRMVVAGYVNGDFAVTRYGPDGRLDLSFGTKTFDLGGNDLAVAMTIDSQDRIVLAGTTDLAAFQVARIKTNGQLDETFNASGPIPGTKTIPWSSGTRVARAVAIDSAGRIVVAGQAEGNFAVARLSTSGAIDTSFGMGDGRRTVELGGNDSAMALAFDQFGRIVLGGGNSGELALARLDANGNPDFSFDDDGKKTQNIGAGIDEIYGLTIGASGTIFCVGGSFNGSFYEVVVGTFSSTGALVGPLGYVTKAFDANTRFNNVYVDSAESKISIVGTTNSGFTIARLLNNNTGAFDLTFDGDGKVSRPIGAAASRVYGSAFDSHGRLVLGGAGVSAGTDAFSVARFSMSQVAASISTGSGAVSIRAADAAVQGTLSSAGMVAFASSQSSRSINLGTEVAGRFSLTNAERGRISAGSWKFGDGSLGEVYVPVNASFAADVDFEVAGKLHLSGGTILAGTNAVRFGPHVEIDPKITTETDVSANVSFEAGAKLLIDISGTTPNTGYARLDLIGSIDLTGLSLALSGSYFPSVGQQFTIVQATNLTGTFAGVLDGHTVEFNGIPLQVDYTATSVILTTLDPRTAEIHGSKWHDLDSDGEWDSNEPALAGWTFFLDLNDNGDLDVSEPSVVTGIDGSYSFTGLAAGNYVVAEIMQQGWMQTYPGPVADGSLAGFSPLIDRERLAQQLASSLTTTGSQASAVTLGDDGDGQIALATAESGAMIGLDNLRADPRFADIDGRGSAVVVLDTGINLTHPFFGNRIVYSWDFADGDPDATDVNGHGSNVSSIIGSQDATWPGVAPGVDIIHLKVFQNNGSGNFTYIENALQWVVAHVAEYNIVSVNMSLGDRTLGISGNYATEGSRYGIGDELAALASLNVIVASAAGNDFYQHQSQQGVSYPASDPNSLAVGAVYASDIGGVSYLSGAQAFSTDADRIAPFSQRHASILDVMAPGAPITGAAATGTGTTTLHGTSQATPHVAGAAALAQQLARQRLGRSLSPIEFRDLLQSTGVIVRDGDDESDNVANTGLDFRRLDVFALSEAIWSMGSQHLVPGRLTVTVSIGEVVEDVDFGNQLVPDVGDTLATSEATGVGSGAGGRSYSRDAAIGEGIQGTRDVDIYKVQANSGSRIAIATSFQGDKPMDTLLRLFDAEGRQIALDDDNGDGVYSQITYTFSTTGTYYIGVSGYSNALYDPAQAGSGANGSVGDYRLTISLNDPPVLVDSPSGGLVNVFENSTGEVWDFAAIDPEVPGQPLSFSTAGPDAARFVIHPTTGVLTFVWPPNFEAALDANGDNVYEVTIIVSDGSLIDSEAIAVTVQNVNEAPSFASPSFRRVSAGAADLQSNGESDAAAISADGRFVAFTSLASNLTPGDTNNVRDVFRKDLLTGEVVRVSVNVAGGQGNHGSYSPSISADGRFVAFASLASNLVAGDSNETFDVFRKDLQTGEVVLVSVDTIGLPGSASSLSPSISADGRYVAFSSDASNLVADDVNNFTDVFRKDLQLGTVVRISGSVTGEPANNNSGSPSISSDGRFVAFASFANNLVTGDTNFQDIFRKDLVTGELTRVSVESSRQANGDSYQPAISADGRYVAFTSNATSLVLGDSNSVRDVFRKDLQTGEIVRVSDNVSGQVGNNASDRPSISADGRYVAFNSDSSNFVVGDTNGVRDPYRKDLQTGALVRLSALASGAQGANGSLDPSISSNGQLIAFVSYATIFVPSDTNGTADVFLWSNGASSQAAMVHENSTSVGTYLAVDPDTAATLVYSLIGPDASKFSLTQAGVLTFIAAPDFENPNDFGGNRTYDLTIQAFDGEFTDSLPVVVTVDDVNEAPVIDGGETATVSVPENTTAVAAVVAVDPDTPPPTLTFSLVGGADQGKFVIHPTTGALSFQAAPDFDVPGDADGDNAYQVVVRVSDGTLTDTQIISVTVTNVNEAPTLIVPGNPTPPFVFVTVPENVTALLDFGVIDPDVPAQTLSFSLVGGSDANLFEIGSIDGLLSFRTAPDFEAPIDSDANNTYVVFVRVSDGQFSDFRSVTIYVVQGQSSVSRVYVDASWSNLLAGTTIVDADSTVNGNQPATFGTNAFAVLHGATEAVVNGGTVTVFPGTYAADASIHVPISLNVPIGIAVVSGRLSGAGNVTKTGNGTLAVSATNTLAGDLAVVRGVLEFASDAALGDAGNVVIVHAPGEVRAVGSTTSSRSFELNDGALSVASGATLTLAGGEFLGGFVKGPGIVATAGGHSSRMSATTLRNSLILNAAGNDSFTNVRNSSVFNVIAGVHTISLDGFVNEGAGFVTVGSDSMLAATDFQTYGQATVAGTLRNVGTKGLMFNGGSATTISAAGSVDVGIADARIAGGFVTNYGALGSATNTVIVDYGGRVQGPGIYHTVITQNGGVFSPGNSPGPATMDTFPINGGGAFDFEISNVTGSAGNVNGWDMATAAPTVFKPAAASIDITATSSNKYTILINSKLNDGMGNTAGAAANFNPAQNYAWKFLDGSRPATTITGTFDPAAFNILTTGFANAFTGTFSVELRDGRKNFYVVYTAPVPAPTVTSVTAFVGPTSGGNVIVIAGTNFTVDSIVKFGAATATNVTLNSATQITATAPAGASTVNVTVTTAGGTSDTSTAGDDYTYSVPAITSVIVNGGAIAMKNRFGQIPVLANQNSVVEQILVTFNMQVKLDANAFDVSALPSISATGILPSTLGAAVTAAGVAGTGDASAGFTQYVLNFAAGAGVNSFSNTLTSPTQIVNFTTLKDGYYRLNMVGSRVHAGLADTALDRSDKFWSLYGAVNIGDVQINGALGDTSLDTLLVDGLALNDVYSTFGSNAQTPAGPPAYNPGFDWNLDGNVDGVDLNQLYKNFGTIWKI